VRSHMINQEYHRLFLYLTIANACKSTDSVLEIGPGTADEPAAQGPVIISEKVGEYVAIGKHEYKDAPFNFVCVDFEKYPITCKYDKIIALYVIEYLDPDDLAERAANHLKPGGGAYFSEGLVWQAGGPRLTPAQIAENFRSVLRVFGGVEIFGITDGIIVPELSAKTGVFCIATN